MASRAKRFDEARDEISSAKTQFEELKYELENWLDNMPENLQSSQKADDLQEAIDELDNIINTCDEIEGAEVNFPGMFG